MKSLRFSLTQHGQSSIGSALIGLLAAATLVAVAYVVVWARSQGADDLTPEEQAYVAAVATQQADAFIAAVATQQAEGPPPASAPEPPQREYVYVTVPATPVVVYVPVPAPSLPPPPPAPAPTQPPPPAPAPTQPPPPSTKTPMQMCVGYMAGLASSGLSECQQIAQGGGGTWSDSVRNCVRDVISGAATTAAGKADCVGAASSAGNANLADCFLGLSGQSHFGATSCRLYYGG